MATSKRRTRRPSRQQSPRPHRPAGPPAATVDMAGERGQIAWGWCLVGLLAGEVLLLVLSNVALGVTNAAFGPAGDQAADGGIVGVSTLLAVLAGAYLAARRAGRFGLYQGVVVGAGFILIGAMFQFAQEASIVHSALVKGTHTLVDLGPMSMGNLLTGDALALVGGSIGGLIAARREPQAGALPG